MSRPTELRVASCPGRCRVYEEDLSDSGQSAVLLAVNHAGGACDCCNKEDPVKGVDHLHLTLASNQQ